MNKKYIFLLIIFSALITLPSFSQSINYNINDVITSMIRKSREIKTIRYHAVMNERIKDKMILKDSYFKINSEPLKIYVQQSFVGIKIEGLYVEGWNNNKLLISTIGFP